MRPTLATTLLLAALTACDAIGEAHLFQLTGPPKPPLEELRVAWTYERPDRYVHYTGLADEQGNLYWLECNDCRSYSWREWCSESELTETPDSEDTYDPPQQLKCELVSALPSGLERWRVPTDLAFIRDVALGPDEVVLIGFRHVYVHELATGALRWTATVEPRDETSIARVGGGRLVVRRWQYGVGRFAAFDLADGASLPAPETRSSFSWAWAVDEQDRLLVRTVDRPDEGSLAAHRDGELLWSIEAEGLGSPVATAGGNTLLVRPTAILRNEDGALLREASGAPWDQRDPEMPWRRQAPIEAVATSDYALLITAGAADDDRLGLRVSRISFDSGAIDWATLVAAFDGGSPAISSPLLTDGGAVLFSWSAKEADADHRENRLVLVDGDGTFRVSRKLPGPGHWSGGAVLHEGLWIAAYEEWRLGAAPRIAITAWEVEGLDLAGAGWVSGGGSPRRNRQALPAR